MVNLVNSTLDKKTIKAGPCFTALFFGFFVPLFRKDWIGVAYMAGGAILLSIIFPPLTLLYNIGVGVAYNYIYINMLIRDGYYPETYHDKVILEKKNIKF